MFNKILIANRGEIACRIIKTAKSMGVLTVAIYSDADKNALHVQMADEAIYIGPSPSRESYLLGDNVIAAAIQTGAQAIHPGYGFLSENADFCRSCAKQNITFIGPPVAAIEAMGSKSAAKNIMEKANVPLVPGYHGDDQSNEVIKKAADDMGYPVLLKATAGGGGKGMRQVWKEQEFAEGLAAAKREAMSSFGDDTMLVEKYLTQPRHVEIQVFCDNHNNAVYLFERDCSVQRRHQKVIEEAPAFGMSEELRAQMGESAIKSAQAIGYQGAGTVEFLLDVDGSFYFMEMNTRLQVEHPVTEMISGQDLVEWQLRVAAGEILPKTQEQLVLNGHAFEARIYAEDPNKDFLPATGKLSLLQTPVESKHVRIDTGVRQGDEVSVYYDPMIAKLIVWDENREKALTRLSKALSEYRINGVTTNIDFLYNLATSQPFIDEEIDTSFIEKNNELIFKNKQQLLQNELPIAALYLILTRQHKTQKDALKSSDSNSPWHNANAWRLNEPYIHSFVLAHNETEYNVEIEQKNHGSDVNYSLNVNGKQFNCQGSLNNDLLITTINDHRSTTTVSLINNNINLYRENGVFNFIHILPDCGQHDNENGHGGLTAPMNGTMISVLVKAGDTVSKNQPLVIMEAMKMEHTIKAPSDGIINEIFFQAGDMVDGGAELLAFSEQINVNDEA
ncbi:acetyl/propionyl/methylcrotonyl-CoA carboxylase subunit alpha [Colwellia sp. 4_MG-2023]|uniref:acetyl/propionyl/methylcrotonyl-CoA carboxylase subunit alpha n=1 Tax=unclassified Colwellia TaxID=196834 RepID=UPI0026E42EA3|nr:MULTISPECIES: acetyl/propionyl/methylcrotonyl-CoA carboxylase subunit alpha [unclassified Colwellia]MDO6508776.1 acetyl/propionyl/methylcrotonyl-CoA carboxylase subunit alpha [Colwellia sp. 5_MG-2023]MDO6557454.1 acetyl/propionyl/methylcrotonyl-CoA carboxylase subunit alpha [Colwellia sp. 4_MG-2023]